MRDACRQGRSDLLMAAFRGMTLRDHLCWVWRMGSGSADPVLAEAALLAAQLLRVLGVEHDSLDTLLCQVRVHSAAQASPGAGTRPPEASGCAIRHAAGARCSRTTVWREILCLACGCMPLCALLGNVVSCMRAELVCHVLAAGAPDAGGRLPEVAVGAAGVDHRLRCAFRTASYAPCMQLLLATPICASHVDCTPSA